MALRLKSTFILILSIVSNFLFSQTQITGKVLNKATNTALMNVMIKLENTNIGTLSDLEGNFQLNCNEGEYRLIFNLVSFISDTIQVKVVKNENVVINHFLDEKAITKTETEIRGNLKRESYAYINVERKNAVSVGDGIPREQLTKTPNNNVGDVLKRITGTSIQEGKFAIIRGMNDRYNASYLNGAPLPSTESDRKAFSFQILPSALVENIMIYKSPSAEYTGDFAGGIIFINTKNIPDAKVSNINLSIGANSITTNKTFKDFRRSKTDLLGFDNTVRPLPVSESFREGMFNTEDYVKYTKEFNNDYKLYDRYACPNINASYTIGNKLKRGANTFGYLGSITYNLNHKFSEVTQKKFRYEDNILDQVLTDNQFNTNVNIGGLLNFGYKIGKKHVIGFKNLINQMSDNTSTMRSGLISGENDIKGRSYSVIFNQNLIASSQLNGEHMLFEDLKFNWILNSGYINRSTPDYRVVNYAGDSEPYMLSLNNNLFSTSTGRFYSNMSEKIKSASFNFVKPLNISIAKADLKFGALTQDRKREFNSRYFSYYGQNGLTGSMETLLGDNNVSTNGVYMKEQSVAARDNYTASSKLNALYTALDLRLFSKLRVNTGIRLENYRQTIVTANDIFIPITIDSTVLDLLPSLNITYQLTKKTNIRLAAGKSINRPEFREVSSFSFFNFNLNSNIKGNTKLQRAIIHNYDFRIETYPKLSDVISLGLFYKKILNPIEMSLDVTQTSIRLFGYDNQKQADNLGLELEYKKGLEDVSKYLKNFTLNLNLTFIHSQIQFNSTTSSTEKRALQGQSPYVFNGGLQYQNKAKQLNVSLNINQNGRRIAYIGAPKLAKYGLDIYENKRTILDCQISKQIKQFEMKLTLGDLLAQKQIFYQDINNDKKYNAGDNDIFQYTMGRTISFQVGYKFK